MIAGRHYAARQSQGARHYQEDEFGFLPLSGDADDAPHGLVVAYAHGPTQFVMRYEDSSVAGAETLNDNPWIDFGASGLRLLEQPRSF